MKGRVGTCALLVLASVLVNQPNMHPTRTTNVLIQSIQGPALLRLEPDRASRTRQVGVGVNTEDRAFPVKDAHDGRLPRRGAPAPTPTNLVTNLAVSRLNWHALALCESSDRPATNTGNGYYGLYQFDLSTWRSVGGRGLPSEASRREQTWRAQMLWQQRGSSPWPVCGRLL